MSARLGGVEVSGNETRTTVSCAAHGIDGSDRLHWIWHYHSTSAFLGAASGRQPCADRPDYHRLLTRAIRLPADPGSPLRSLWPPPCDSLVTAHRDSILHLLSALWHISAAARRPLHRRYGGSEPRLSAGGRLRLDHSSRPRERDGHDRRGDWSDRNLGSAQAVVSDSTTPADRAKGMGMIGAAIGPIGTSAQRRRSSPTRPLQPTARKGWA